MKGVFTVTEPENVKWNKSFAFKNNASFINSISKINGVQTDNAEDLDVVISMYNLLECSKNFRKTRVSLWNYYKDEPNNPLSPNSESFKYKTSITEILTNLLIMLIMMQPKITEMKLRLLYHYKTFCNLWRTLNIPLIKCETELTQQ